MQAIVKNTWYSVARDAGASEDDCSKIQSAFDYEGFSYDIISSNT